MERTALALLVALSLVSAGCFGQAPDAAPTDPSPGSPSATPTGNVSVEYRVTAGDLPAEFRSVNVTLRVVFVEDGGDIPACWRETFRGPYKPTPTPVATPTGGCHWSAPVTVDLTDVSGSRSLGPFTAPGSYAAGHGLIVTEIGATDRNGSSVSGIRGTGGHVANVVRGRSDTPLGVELAVESYRDRPYDYWLVSEAVQQAD